MTNLLSRLSLKALILSNALILLALLTICSGYAILSMSQIGEELEGIADLDIPLTAKISSVTEHQLEQAIHFERAVRYGEQAERQHSGAAAKFASEAAAFDKLVERVSREFTEAEELAAHAVASAHNEVELKEFTKIAGVLRSMKGAYESVVSHSEEVFAHLREHRLSDAELMAEKVEHEEDLFIRSLEELLQEISVFTARSADAAREHEEDALNTLGMLLAVSFLVGVLVSVYTIRCVWRQIGHEPRILNAISQQIAAGDLSVELSGTGNAVGVYASIIEMLNSLKSLIDGIQRGAQQVSSSSQELANVTERTHLNLSSQHQSTEQVATAITEMTAAVEEVAKNTTAAADAARDARLQVSRGGELVTQTVQGVQNLSQQLDETTSVIGQLEQGATEISSILDVIKGIADQTNLLALNAAIEAARAGEQGRGFAVVADEVRALAKNTQESASEIESMISGLQASANSSVKAMKLGSEQAMEVMDQSGQVTEALDQIQQVVGSISDMNAQIAAAAEEQKAVAEDISQNISGISNMSQQTGESAQLLTETSDELARLSVDLQDNVRRFHLAG